MTPSRSWIEISDFSTESVFSSDSEFGIQNVCMKKRLFLMNTEQDKRTRRTDSVRPSSYLVDPELETLNHINSSEFFMFISVELQKIKVIRKV